MAVTRRWQSGVESGNVSKEFDAVSGPPVINGTAKTGAYSCRNNIRFANRGIVYVPATRQVQLAAYIRFAGYGDGTGGNFFSIESAVSANIVVIGFTGTAKGSHDFSIWVNGSWRAITTSHPLELNEWKHFVVDVKIDAAAGWVKVWIDGILEYDFSGNTGNVDIDEIDFGSNVGTGGVTTAYQYYDDMLIDDTAGESAPVSPPPAVTFAFLTLDGNGNYADWMGSDGNQVDNYQLVDERPPSEADYVEIAAVDQFDSYAMITYVIGVGETVDALIPLVYVKRDNTSEEIALGTRYSGADLIGSDQVPNSSSNFLWERQTTKPGGGAWDQASLDGVEALIKSRGSY